MSLNICGFNNNFNNLDLLPQNGGQILKEMLNDSSCDVSRFKLYNGQEMRDDDFLHVRKKKRRYL